MAEVLQGNIPPPPEPEAINTTAQGSAEPPPVEVPLAAGDVQPNAPEPLQDSAKTETDKPDASAHPDDSRADRPIRESRKCYKCGGVGHIAVMCPSPQGSVDHLVKGQECKKCGGAGHWARSCPNNIDASVCFICKRPGHHGRACPFAPSVGRPGMPGPMGYGGMAGMPSYYRPPPPSSNGIQSRDICYRCGQPGHRARECSMPEGQFKCFQCGQDGHMARDCPNARHAPPPPPPPSMPAVYPYPYYAQPSYGYPSAPTMSYGATPSYGQVDPYASYGTQPSYGTVPSYGQPQQQPYPADVRR